MDSAFIHQAANELVQNAGTRNIKQIARSCSLDISETSRIKDMLGLLSLYTPRVGIIYSEPISLAIYCFTAYLSTSSVYSGFLSYSFSH